jgi:hypothetical protein
MRYALAEWFRHLHEGAPISQESLFVLMKFLKGSSMLVWIQALAGDGQLRTPISASSYLSRWFADKLRRGDLDVIPSDRKILERKMMEDWSTDLVKVVGKFGANLARTPEAIHRLMPPFCPQDSVLYRQYGRREIKSLSVGGFSNTSWDDSHARLSCPSLIWIGNSCC